MKKIKKTILAVDDTETNIDIILELLGEKYDVIVALDGYSAIEIVKEDTVDLILLDIMMPKIDGFEVCRRLKSDDSTSHIPIIFITAASDEKNIETAYEAGGDDYIPKPFKPLELLARINTQLKVKEYIRQLNYKSSHDEMTGIYNRRKFFELGEKRFEKNSKNLYAVMIDIDKFKNINDIYGHPTGDEAICLVAKTVSKFLLDNAIFARIGGEEFAILCSYPSSESVVQNMEQIREAVECLEIISEDSKGIKLTISQGISKRTEKTGNLDELLRAADTGLYEAKHLGRNRVVFK